MSIPQEHDYIGFSGTLPAEKIPGKTNNALNLTETELRLGLPGSGSPERKPGSGVSIFGKDLKDKGNNGFSQNPLKNFVSGAKRGFADAVNGSGKWVLSINSGSEVDLGQADGLFSPREVNGSSFVKTVEQKKNGNDSSAPASKAQVVGWPPVRSFHKNTLTASLSKNSDATGKSGSGHYVKVSMDGAPYLRKVDLNTYGNYAELSKALEKMFSCFTIGQYGDGLAGKEHLSESRLIDLLHGSEYVLTYEDKDGDWMLVGDVPWKMFTDSCKRLRIMKGSDAIGLAPRTMQKCKSQN